MRGFAFARSHPALDAWRSGRTGFPLVDAGIRELRATGWMHPRLRAIAASFLCFDLGVDWRVGRDDWDRYLIEDAPALAVGNWQWIAGVGADLAAYPRIYNPLKQARRFDPAAQYVRRWIPELAGLPDAAILDPLDAPAAGASSTCRSSASAATRRRCSTTSRPRARSWPATRARSAPRREPCVGHRGRTARPCRTSRYERPAADRQPRQHQPREPSCAS